MRLEPLAAGRVLGSICVRIRQGQEVELVRWERFGVVIAVPQTNYPTEPTPSRYSVLSRGRGGGGGGGGPGLGVWFRCRGHHGVFLNLKPSLRCLFTDPWIPASFGK